MKDLKSMTIEEIEALVKDIGQPKFRTKQIADWLSKGVTSLEEMRNLPKDLITKLSQYCYISVANIEKKQVSMYDSTVKYLFSFRDEKCVESVVMSYHHGYTICISTQVGCKMGCTFCATGKQGFTRNLSAGEMLSQIESAQRDLGIRISNIVLMGMGEPLDNYDNVLRFINLVSSEKGLNIGKRHITLSTCGVVPKIYSLADERLQITLSVSLHAPNDELRSKTMPINNAYNIGDLIKAIRYYIDKTGRRVSFEYAMIDGVNDSDDCANQLGRLIRGMLCHVNLIPVNSVKGTSYRKSNKDRLNSFIEILSKYGVTATIRRTLGSDIDASCGQLKGKYEEERDNLGNLQ
jgi:23S rRNA (adenine2503-C2)-methyltransferase